jgi:UDP-N-acetylmuramoylalanine--D-glutamate ligase
MIPVSLFKGQTVAVFGLARTGLSAARALAAGGAKVIAWDDKEAMRLPAAKADVPLDPWQRWPWTDLKALVLSPGVPLTHPTPHAIVTHARSAGVEIIGDMELFGRTIAAAVGGQNRAPVIAITGTNGKSTTTALIGHILQSCGFVAEVGGNIGKAVLDLNPPGGKTVYVLEVSSYQVDLAPNLRPDVSVLTNISPDHIDRHGSMENYVSVKASLLQHTQEAGQIVIGVDDAHSARIFSSLMSAGGAHAIPVSAGKVLGRGVFAVDGKLYDAVDHTPNLVMDLLQASHLPGVHNWQNAALAYAAVKSIVRDPRAVASAIQRFPGLAHRMEDVGTVGKVRFVNDSKATNADAAAKALVCFPDIFWIAGGKAKEGGITDLSPHFSRIRKAYLIGDAAHPFAETLEGRVAYEKVGTLERAVAVAYSDAMRSAATAPVVLLSPACASFDQFRDFEQRGDVFRTLARNLIPSALPQKEMQP